ncbi:MAG: HK97 family phage prohead protease [Anaerolineae bacterium]|nr:HK97 family phage prohead protease [Anaerolineae bacterium]
MRFLKRKASLIGTPADGVVEHVISVFGNTDDGGDVVLNGAFAKTLQESGPQGADRIRATWQHDLWEPIGRPLEMTEIGRQDLPEKVLARAPGATGGLRVVTKLSMTQRGRDAYTLLLDGVLNEWSIGYYPVKWDWDSTSDVRRLMEVMLVEYGLVTLAMNSGAITSDVKAVVSYQDLPIGDEETPWDGAAAEQNVREWAGGADDITRMDWEMYRKAFVLWDRDNAEQLGSYKLQIADIVDGELTAMPRGIFAAAVALQGGRSPIAEFQDGDVDGAKRHISRYYERMGLTAPWDRYEASAARVLVEMVLAKGKPTKPVGLEQFVSDLVRLEAPGASGAWLDQVERFSAAWVANATLLKEGRVLSGTNVKLVQNAVTQMQEAIQALNDLLDAAEPGREKRASLTARAVLERRLALQLSEVEHFMRGGAQ